MAVLVDSTVLSNFAVVSRLELLTGAFAEDLYVTHEVQQEALHGVEEGHAFLQAVVERIGVGRGADLRLTGFQSEAEEDCFRVHALTLGYGEASCLAVAKSRGWVVLTDDRTARTRLRKNGIRVSGTLGVLHLAVERGRIELGQANGLLAQMIAHGYRSPCTDLAQLD